MSTLYNQYIYKNGAWRKTGTSSESVTYAISLSGNTLTLTGSDGSTSTVTIQQPAAGIQNITVNGTTITVVDGTAAITVPTKTSDLTNDSGFITTSDIPEGAAASTTTPKMDGTAKTGTELAFARGDHVHPSDTSRVPTTRKINGHALSSDVTITASDVGLGNVEDGAEVNVQSDWNVTNSASDAYIKNKPSIPSKVSDLTNDSGFITSYTETDPTVPAWAKAETKPSYTASEVGAAASSHTHGNITNAGALQTTDVAIANGDKLVVTDASNSNKVARTSAAFDGSTATKALTQKGTFEEFNNYKHPTYSAANAAAVKVGRDASGHVVVGSALTAADVGALPSTTSIPSNTSDLTNDSGFLTSSDITPITTAEIDAL